MEVLEEVIGEDIIRDWLCKPGVRESLIIPDSPTSSEADAVEEVKPTLPLKMKRRSAYTTQLEIDRMREEADWSISNPNPSPVVTVSRPVRSESQKKTEEKDSNCCTNVKRKIHFPGT